MSESASSPAGQQPSELVHLRVAAWASSHPDAPAVIEDGRVLTYHDLTVAAGRLAALLRERHGPASMTGQAVGLLMPRSARAVVAELAILWSGGHYVPLDPEYPPPRIAAMLAGASARLTIGEADLIAAAGLADSSLTLPSDDWLLGGPSYPAELGRPDQGRPGQLGYVMYTSGSTGVPKGVAIPAHAIAKLAVNPQYAPIGARCRVLLHSPLTFDASTMEMWAPLANEGTVVVATPERPSIEQLTRTIERHPVQVAFVTTGLFHRLASRRSRLLGLVPCFLVGGEEMSPALARAALRAFPGMHLINAYGPTEATTFTTAHRVSDADCDGPLPIGRPVNGATVHLLDQSMRPVRAGSPGDLWIGGTRLAAGYVGDARLTSDKFVDLAGIGRLYRSGDRAVARPDGTLEYLGRADEQVKVRGFRVEPGEVEHALLGCAGVAAATVVTEKATAGDGRLVAFVVPASDPPTPELLRADLARRLPRHLIPDMFVLADELPLTASGKVDRDVLTARAKDVKPPPTGATRRMSPAEQAVARVWLRAFGVSELASDADFLALGGHSLLALEILDELGADLGVHLDLADFFAEPTIAATARLVEQGLAGQSGGSQPDGRS